MGEAFLKRPTYETKGLNLKTVILAGGFGTRIRDVAADIPKPMIPIGQVPILLHIMRIYGAANFREFVLALGYKGDVIKQYFLNYQTNAQDITISLGRNPKVILHENRDAIIDDWTITLADTGQNAMTGARVQRIKRYVDTDDNFMLTYGDGVSNVKLDALVAFHRNHGRILTITGVYPPGRFGELTVRNGSEVIGFNEKPQASGGLISGGFFVCSRRIFDYLNDDDNLVFEQEPMRRLTADGQVRVYHHQGFWHPLDTYRDYKFLNDLWDRGAAPWKTW
jgi:glucose-1-phosphate cytidylyltransferase